jgi:hypothetical protein
VTVVLKRLTTQFGEVDMYIISLKNHVRGVDTHDSATLEGTTGQFDSEFFSPSFFIPMIQRSGSFQTMIKLL